MISYAKYCQAYLWNRKGHHPVPGKLVGGVLFFRVSLNILRILLLRMIRHTLMIHGLHFLLMSRQLWYFVFMGNN